MTGAPSPSAGHSGLSGWEMVTPMTTAEPRGVAAARSSRARRAARARSSAGAGVSASTSAAGLSSRRPLNAAWRIAPSPVKPANSISATSSGLTQWIAGRLPRRAGAGERARRRSPAPSASAGARRPCRGRSPCRPGRRGPAGRRGRRRRSASGTPRRWWSSRRSPPRGPARHLALIQALAAARAVGRVEPLGDDALRDPCGRRSAAPRRRRSRNARHSGCAPPALGEQAPSAAPCARRAAGRAGPRRRRTAGRRRRRSGRRSCRPTSAACRAAKSGAPVWSSATTSPSMMPSGRASRRPRRSPGTWRSSRGPCGSAARALPPSTRSCMR